MALYFRLLKWAFNIPKDKPQNVNGKQVDTLIGGDLFAYAITNAVT